MNHKQNIIVTLQSHQDGERISHTHPGEWFVKGKAFYIRYVEQTELGEVRNLIRYERQLLSHTRKGAVESEQTYVPNDRRMGYYDNKVIKIELEAQTATLSLLDSVKQPIDGLPSQLPFFLEWTYQLFVGEQQAGEFEIRLIIQEG